MPEIPGSRHQNSSLRGKITTSDLGSRVVRTAPDDVANKRDQANKRQAMGPLLDILSSCLPDVSQQILDSAASIVIDIMRDEGLSEASKKSQLEQVLGQLDAEKLHQISTFVRKIEDDSDAELQNEDSDSDPSASSSSESESESESEPEVEEPWKTDPHFIKNLVKETGFAVEEVVSTLESGNMPDLPVDVAAQLTDEVLCYHKYLNAETGVEREAAQAKLPQAQRAVKRPRINLETLIPSKMARFYADPNVDLPEGTEKSIHKSYEQYAVPATPPGVHSTELVPVTALDEPHRAAFAVEYLNVVQSAVFAAAYKSAKNLLLCSPTGSGKTNVALLTILQAPGTIVYVSPLKALVQEQVRTFSERLGPLGISVAELTGDSNLTSAQLAETRMIITTPEKWDVVSRRGVDVSLLIIDEIHLLHDPRGPALENIVARCHMLSASKQPRIVGLSATLPNYQDVANFLDADCFYFDASYRPCPLALNFIGVTEKSPFKQHQALNDILLEKLNQIEKPTIVFVHSRKDTLKTALFLKEMGLKGINEACGEDLKQALAVGVGIHHAGMSKQDRALVEQLFAARKLRVLVSTATLAWGVNLPAHAVIIKGTQLYNPQEGQWIELSPQDVLQMLGRAGRPGFDTEGQGYILTMHDQLAYYMSILTAQFPIESQLIGRLLDSVNAEVASGTITTLEQGVTWLGLTYYFQRLKASPHVYRAGIVNDEEFVDHRRLIVHSALCRLRKLGMVEYASDKVRTTPKGKIASQFYISPESMALYAQQLKPYFSAIDVFRVFARSKEFENLSVREQESAELQRLESLVPFPIKDKGAYAKTSMLLQACISRASLDGYSIAADMTYIVQSASRLFRAMFELSVAMGWAQLAYLMHDLYLEVDKQLWLTSSPFRQWDSASESLVKRTENSPMPWSNYLSLSREEVGSLLRENADLAWSLLRQFPRLEASAVAQPLSPTLLRIVVDIAPIYTDKTPWIVLVCDGDGEFILHKERFVHARTLNLVVPLLDPPSPSYFVHLINDSWLHAKHTLEVDLETMIVPKPFVPPTPVKQMELVKGLNQMQSQVYYAVKGQENVFVGMLEDWAPLVREAAAPSRGRIVVLSPSKPQDLGSNALWLPFNATKLPSDFDVLVVTHAHLIGSQNGYQLERTLVRLKQQIAQRERQPRIVVFSYPIAGWDLARWLSIPKQNIFNFRPSDSIDVEVTTVDDGSRPHVVHATDMTAVELLSKCHKQTLVVCPDRMLEYYKRFTRQPLPVESNLMYFLDDALMIEAADGTVNSGEDALDWLSSSYFYYRLLSNPSYYGLKDTSEDGVNEYLSELIETALEELEFVEVVDEDLNVVALEGAKIAAHWGLSLSSLQTLWSLNGSSKLEDIFRAVSSCDFAEFDVTLLKPAQSKVPFAGGNSAMLLLQVYLSRLVPKALEPVLVPTVERALSYTCAAIDILSSQGALNVLVAVDIHQMLMQALWARESPLKQIPHVDDQAIERAAKLGVTSINDFLAIEDDEVRTELLGFDETDARIAAVAEFVNDFPSIELEVGEGHVTITRDSEASVAHTFGGLFDREEQWYLFVGDLQNRQLLQVQKLRPEEVQQVAVPHTGAKVWCVCISYLDADREADV